MVRAYRHCLLRGAQHTVVMPKRTVMVLGRHGDILNLLPAIRSMAHTDQHQVGVCVAAAYQSILDGVSYVKPFVWPGLFEHPHKARAWLRRNPDIGTLLNATVYGEGFNLATECSHFTQESWRLIGAESWWGTLPLCFDRRNYSREAAWVKDTLRVESDRPVLLVSFKALSAPFAQADRILEAVKRRWHNDFQIIDIGAAANKAERIYDLLGLYDRAAGLVTVDTATYHLALGGNIRTLLLRRDDDWRSTSPHPQIDTELLLYSEVEKNPDVLVEAIAKFLPVPPFDGKIFHAVSPYGTEPRHDEARRSWEHLYERKELIACPVTRFSRTAKTVLGGQARELPFLKDVLWPALERAGDQDAVLFCNDDDILHPELIAQVRKHLERNAFGCVRRIDVSKNFDYSASIIQHYHSFLQHPGRDVFVFKAGWLRQHWHELPDFLTGASRWDFFLGVWFRRCRGITAARSNLFMAELPGVELRHGGVFHVGHPAHWWDHQNDWTEKYNELLCASHLSAWGLASEHLE